MRQTINTFLGNNINNYIDPFSSKKVELENKNQYEKLPNIFKELHKKYCGYIFSKKLGEIHSSNIYQTGKEFIKENGLFLFTYDLDDFHFLMVFLSDYFSNLDSNIFTIIEGNKIKVYMLTDIDEDTSITGDIKNAINEVNNDFVEIF